MKRILWILAVLMVCASVVEASVWSTIQDYTVSGLITVFFAIVAAIFGKKWLAFKTPIQALLQVFWTYRSAKLLQSEGGKDISKAEWNKIFADMTAAVEAIVAAMPASWLPNKPTPRPGG